MSRLDNDVREMIAAKYKYQLLLRTIRLVVSTKLHTPNNEKLLEIFALIEAPEDVSEVDAALLAKKLFALDGIGVSKDGRTDG